MSTALITIGIFIALVAGFFAGRWHGMSQRSKQLSEELEQKEEELNALKSNVNDHFSETARLFTNLTEEYKSLYKHLAKGATELSDESFKLSLAAPNETLIDHEPELAAKPEVSNENSDVKESEVNNTQETSDDVQIDLQAAEPSANDESAKENQPEQPVDYYKEAKSDQSNINDSDENLEPNTKS